MAKIPKPFSMAKLTGPMLGGLAFIGAFNDIPLIHYLWLSLVFVISQFVFLWLQNAERHSSPANTWRATLWSWRQVFFVMLGVAAIAYLPTAALLRIPFSILVVDIGAAALIAAMGFAHHQAESENRRWKILLFRASQKHELSADDLKFLAFIIGGEG